MLNLFKCERERERERETYFLNEISFYFLSAFNCRADAAAESNQIHESKAETISHSAKSRTAATGCFRRGQAQDVVARQPQRFLAGFR